MQATLQLHYSAIRRPCPTKGTRMGIAMTEIGRIAAPPTGGRLAENGTATSSIYRCRWELMAVITVSQNMCATPILTLISSTVRSGQTEKPSTTFSSSRHSHPGLALWATSPCPASYATPKNNGAGSFTFPTQILPDQLHVYPCCGICLITHLAPSLSTHHLDAPTILRNSQHFTALRRIILGMMNRRRGVE